MNLSAHLDDDELAALARTEPVIERARQALVGKTLGAEGAYTLTKSALAMLLSGEAGDWTRAVNALALALAGLEGEINAGGA